MTVPFAVFASGSGSNLQALLDGEGGRTACRYRVALVVANRPCAAEDRAKAAGRPVRRLDFDAPDVGARALDLLARRGIAGVLLAGFLKLLPAQVCRALRGRILNVHPALLPSFGGRGMHGAAVHAAVLRSGAKLSGPTVHLVDERYDEGPIVAQWPVAVLPDDTPESLAARVLEVEHRLYPAAADALARCIARWDGAGECPRPSFRWPAPTRAGSAPSAASLGRAFGAGPRPAGADLEDRATAERSDETLGAAAVGDRAVDA